MTGSIIILIILILINAFFAAAEIAFISLNDAKIEVQVKDGNKKAKKIQNMLKNPSKFLATIQIGVTLAGFLSSAFASDTFADKLAPLLNTWIPSVQLSTWKSVSIIIITIILSYFTLVFGELVPKRLAMKYYEKISFASIGVIKTISIITAPFVRFLTFSTNIVSKLFGVTGEEEDNVTEEEIRMMVDVGEEKGTIEEEEKEMINNVFEFNDKFVSEIMVPRNKIFAIDIDTTISEVIERLSEDMRYSRIPVYDENMDNIKGVVYIKDLLISTKNKNSKIKSLVKEAYFVSETKRVNELFQELRKDKKQIAIVLDEYGGTAGMVTMEDILEEIVGEIYDEYDKETDKFKKIDNNTFLPPASVALYDVEKFLDIDIEDDDVDTLGGYLIKKLDRIPKDGEKPVVETEKITYKIEKVQDRKIIKVKACKNKEIVPKENS